VPPPGFYVDWRRAVSPSAIHVLSPDLVGMDNLIIIPLSSTEDPFRDGMGHSPRSFRMYWGRSRKGASVRHGATAASGTHRWLKRQA
jgi:hypothetical protein